MASMAQKDMESTSNENKTSMRNDARDRLSELPDDILVHILSFLPILDAVRTMSIRRFGNLWTVVSSLDIKDSEVFKAENWPSSAIVPKEQIPCFTSFVRNVLMLHKGIPINSFLLHFYDIYVCDESLVTDIKLWIRFAIGREVKELQVQFETDTYDVYILPRCVFTSQFLVELKLHNCRIELLSRVQMVSLRKLSLSSIMMCNEMFEKIISGCPSLQELVMLYVDEVNEVRFTARNIEKLDISSFGLFEIDCPNLKILNIHLSCREESSYLRGVNIPSVHEVHLQSIDEYDYILNKICKVEVVKFSEDAFQQSIFKEVNIPQTRWNCLHIELSQLNEYQLIGIFRVLRSSPHLEKLIVFSNSQENMKQALGMLSEELSMSSPCVLPLLKTVTIRGYRVACQSQLRLAECLLKSCVTLEKMVILPSTYELVAIEELKFVKRLCSFPRASANARVVWRD